MKKKNIILITTDQMRFDSYGIKNKSVITPNLDEISKNGFDFHNSYCTSPTCTPSRAAIFTGRYPQNIGAWNIGVSLNESEITIADWLKGLGYHNVGVGKMHFRPQMRDHGGETGTFEEIDVRDRGREKDNTYFGFDEHFITEDDKRGKYLDWLKEIGIEVNEGKGNDGINNILEEHHQTYWVGKQSCKTIENHDFKEKPLFMWTSFVDPHHPFDPIEKFVDLYKDFDYKKIIKAENLHYKRPIHLQKQTEEKLWPGGGQEHNYTEKEINEIIKYYFAMITFIDQEIGKILNSLKEKEELKNTIIIFTSDHGEYLGDHGLLKKGPFLNDSLIKVPLIFYGAGIKSGQSEAIVENVDILPTVLDYLGKSIPYGIQGKSLKSIIDGKSKKVKDGAITTYDAHDVGVFIKSYREERYKLVIYQGEEYGELFDLLKDPNEVKNLYFDENYKEVKNNLTLQLCHRLIKDSDPLPEKKACW